jgi:UDP-N-acetylmuramyl pentapeptide phosphotransferase/UDP-N-acetylglucosamine-1-phosphate transferase
MAEQSFANHAHRPTHTGIVWLLAAAALTLMVMQLRGSETRDWAILIVILAIFEIGWISRIYTVKLQDRIIMLEVKVRAAELLDAGQDAQLAKLNSKQIAALRFASDAEFGALLARAARENLPPKDIKAAIKTWRPDLYRT